MMASRLMTAFTHSTRFGQWNDVVLGIVAISWLTGFVAGSDIMIGRHRQGNQRQERKRKP